MPVNRSSGSLARQRLPGIDLLRGIAVLAVIAIHVPHYAPGGWREHPFFFLGLAADFGYLGVPLFIVISGFCIHRKAAMARAETGSYRLSWRRFWLRRFWRLYPPYVAAIAFSLLLAGLVHHNYAFDERFPMDLATHLLLVHNLTAQFSTGLSNGAFWTLDMEEQLYALYFPLFFALRRWGWLLAGGFIGAFALLWGMLTADLGSVGHESNAISPGAWFSWPFAYWFHWALGALAVDVCLRNQSVSRIWFQPGAFLILFAGGILTNHQTHEFLLATNGGAQWFEPWAEPSALKFFHTASELLFAGAFFVLVLWASRNPVGVRAAAAWAARPLVALGQISYSVYLTHVPVIYCLTALLPLDDMLWTNWPLRYAVYVPAVLLVGWGFFLVVERRFLRRYPTGYFRTSASTVTQRDANARVDPGESSSS